MSGLTYLSLAELEAIAFEFPGFEIVAAQGVAGPEWHLRVPDGQGREVLHRAHRPVHAPAEAVNTR